MPNRYPLRSKSHFPHWFLAGLLISSWSITSVTATAATMPNIVVLLSDDLGFRDIGCYGGPVSTPHLDELAARGTRFTDFYSGCAVCSPSRATLLTGRHHIRTGVYSWIHDASQQSHLLLRETTLAEVLKDAGYQTAHIGKWHLGLPTAERDKPTPSDHGFDFWFATENNAIPSHRNPHNFLRNGVAVGELQGYSCQLVADEAIAQLRSMDRDRPFFLNVWFHEPHAPIAAPDDLVAEYGKLDDPAAVYSGTIANADRAIGRLFDTLDNLGELEETLIVYASDNGSYRRDRVGNLRGRKGVNWEGGIRVPGIFAWPTEVREGAVETTPAGVADVLPTLCGLIGVDKPEVHLDGSDLSPLLRKSSDRSFERHQPLWWHLQKSRPIVAMRDGDFSLVAEPDFPLSTSNMFDEQWIPTIKQGRYHNFQLFQLRDDPGQTRDISEQYPKVFARMKGELLRINQSVMADGKDWHLQTEPAE